MNASASAIVRDLQAIRDWCSGHGGQPLPPTAVDYLNQNRFLLRCLVKKVRALPNRAQLQGTHRELDENVISPEFFDIASEALERAKAIRAGNPLVELTDDDIHMLLRVIDYAKYLGETDCVEHPLSLSPLTLS